MARRVEGLNRLKGKVEVGLKRECSFEGVMVKVDGNERKKKLR